MIVRNIKDRTVFSAPQTWETVMTALLSENEAREANHLTPQKDDHGRYVTSPETLNRVIDPRIFFETQTKRFCRFLSYDLPLIRHFFYFIFVFTLGMKLKYFDENENKQPESIYASPRENAITPKVANHFQIHNLGHATQLIQTGNVNILTDPVFGHLGRPFYPSMTKSLNRDFKVKDLPRIDVILISHNHRDHVDEASLKAFVAQDSQPTLLVPLGDQAFFEKLGFKQVREMGWHDEITLKNITFCATPADHRSGRLLHDAHKSLVNGWIISPNSRDEIVYFAGDTARLNDARMKSLALDMFALHQSKENVSPRPRIINLCPGGPNYTRRDMVPTHQSAIDSILSTFRLATELYRIDSSQSALAWLNCLATSFMHQNRFELGPDRFNENFFIYNRLISYLRMTEDELQTHRDKQEKKSVRQNLFHRRKDFILDGVKPLRDFAKEIWGDATSPVEVNDRLIAFLNARTHFPLINQKALSQRLFQYKPEENEQTTMRPQTTKGTKYRKQ